MTSIYLSFYLSFYVSMFLCIHLSISLARSLSLYMYTYIIMFISSYLFLILVCTFAYFYAFEPWCFGMLLWYVCVVSVLCVYRACDNTRSKYETLRETMLVCVCMYLLCFFGELFQPPVAIKHLTMSSTTGSHCTRTHASMYASARTLISFELRTLQTTRAHLTSRHAHNLHAAGSSGWHVPASSSPRLSMWCSTALY